MWLYEHYRRQQQSGAANKGTKNFETAAKATRGRGGLIGIGFFSRIWWKRLLAPSFSQLRETERVRLRVKFGSRGFSLRVQFGLCSNIR